MQADKIKKRSIRIFFTNFNKASIREYQSYKNIDQIKILLIESLYSKITR